MERCRLSDIYRKGSEVMKTGIQRVLSSKWLIICCRVILGSVFIYAAIGKILDPKEFADSVAAFHILPVTSVNVFAIVLPWVELIAGLLLLLGLFVRSSALLLLLMNIVFMFAVGSAMARGLDIDCGCFTLSNEHDRVGWSIIARDAVLLALCIPVLARRKKINAIPIEPLPEEPKPEKEDLVLRR